MWYLAVLFSNPTDQLPLQCDDFITTESEHVTSFNRGSQVYHQYNVKLDHNWRGNIEYAVVVTNFERRNKHIMYMLESPEHANKLTNWFQRKTKHHAFETHNYWHYNDNTYVIRNMRDFLIMEVSCE